MLESTSKFKVHDVVYKNEKDGFAIARGYWDGQPHLRLACRWYEDGGLGYPQTFGKPQWMMFPETKMAVEIVSNLDLSQSKVEITFT